MQNVSSRQRPETLPPRPTSAPLCNPAITTAAPGVSVALHLVPPTDCASCELPSINRIHALLGATADAATSVTQTIASDFYSLSLSRTMIKFRLKLFLVISNFINKYSLKKYNFLRQKKRHLVPFLQDS